MSSIALSASTSGQSVCLDPATPIHFVGIGGIGMSGLAKVLAKAGFTVSGSDVAENAYVKALRELGILVAIGQRTENVPEDSVLVVSTAIHSDNPELVRAQELKLPIVHRSQVLRDIFQGPAFGFETTLGITGTHGKTSVTGMTGMALHAAGMDPTIVAGGKIPGFDSNAVVGDTRKVVVAELDESDGSVVAYNPRLAILTNLELDHAEHFPGGMDDLVATIRQFIQNLPDGATLIANGSCPATAKLLTELPGHVQLVLVSPKVVLASTDSIKAHYQTKDTRLSENGCYQATVTCHEQKIATISLSTPGWHQLENALMAIAACHQLDANMASAIQGINGFSGMGRRFERLENRRGAVLIDDYAHHPTEIATTLKTARHCVGNRGRVLAVFQPHRYTRLKTFWNEFQASLTDAHLVWVTDVFAASESALDGINAQAFVEALQERSPSCNVVYMPTDLNDPQWSKAKQTLDDAIQPGDMVLSLGAGSVTHLLRNW